MTQYHVQLLHPTSRVKSEKSKFWHLLLEYFIAIMLHLANLFFFKCALRNYFLWTWDFYLIKFYSQKICWKIQFHQGSNIRWSEKFQNVCCRSLRYILQISLIIKHFFYQTPSSYVMLLHGVWKSQKKVSFTIASDASYIYILSGLKFIKIIFFLCRYSMAKKFAHLTAQMKTEKRISRQLEQSSCTVAAAATLSITHTTSASMAVTSSSISSLQRSSSSGSSSSPHRLQHSSSCRHYKGSDRVDHPSLHSGSSGSPATSQKYHHHYHHNHLHHHSPHNSSQDTDAGNDSSSSNSNQVCKDEKVVKKWVENIRQNELVLRFYCVTIYQRHCDKKNHER